MEKQLQLCVSLTERIYLHLLSNERSEILWILNVVFFCLKILILLGPMALNALFARFFDPPLDQLWLGDSWENLVDMFFTCFIRCIQK